MLQKKVEEIEALRRKQAEIGLEIQRKIDALVISVVSEGTDEAGLSERDIVVRLHSAGFELAMKEAYSLLTRLVAEQRIQSKGPRYVGIRPEVMKRQLRETSSRKK
jgi:hypothetical protein